MLQYLRRKKLNKRRMTVNGSEILMKYLELMGNPEITYPEVKSSRFYENELTLLAVRIANDHDLSQCQQMTFQVHGKFFVLMKAKRYWEISLPYFNPQVIRHYQKNPPVDLTAYAEDFQYHYYTEFVSSI